MGDMKAHVSLKPFKSKAQPAYKFAVFYPTVEGRRRKLFRTLKDARTFRGEQEVDLANLGGAAVVLTEEVKRQAIDAVERLEPIGASIADAVDYYLLRKGQAHTVTISEAGAKHVDQLRHDGASERHLKDVEQRLNRFQRDVGDIPVGAVDQTLAQEWLNGLALSAVAKRNFRTVLHGFFRGCVDRGIIAENPFATVRPPKVKRDVPGIFTPEQLRECFSIAEGDDLVAAIAIGAFAGLRGAEIGRLTWQDINFASGHIDLRAQATKSAQRRIVELLPAARSWLEPIRRARGSICQTGFDRRTRELHKAIEWPHNVLRHSFASHHLALYENAPLTAALLGHTSTQMIYTHYREAVPKEQAQEWFEAVRPDAGDKVVAITGG